MAPTEKFLIVCGGADRETAAGSGRSAMSLRKVIQMVLLYMCDIGSVYV